MAGDGWIKLHRRFLDWEWYSDTNMVRLFLHLILMANHEDKKWRSRTIARGQVLTSLAQLAEQTGLSTRSIRTCLEKLKSTNEVTIQATNLNRVITVCKYDTYQNKETATDKPVDKPSVTPATNDRQTNKQELKKVRRKEEEKALTPPCPLDCPEFLSKWDEWMEFRKASKFKKLLPVSIAKKWKEMAEWGVLGAIESIDTSIKNGYQGLFEPKAKTAVGRQYSLPQQRPTASPPMAR